MILSDWQDAAYSFQLELYNADWSQAGPDQIIVSYEELKHTIFEESGSGGSGLAFAGVSPDAWTGFCEATGVRPPENAFPGVWRLLAYLFVQKVGPAEGVKWLRLAGPATTGLWAFMFYLTTRMMPPRFLNFSSVHPIWERVLVRVTVLLATLTFVFSPPVMTLTQAFTADVFHLLLALVALCLLYQFVQSARTFWLYLELNDTSQKKEGPKLSALKWRLTLVHLGCALFASAAERRYLEEVADKL